jgi:hypothetical protein
LATREVADRNYYAQFDSFEFQFVTSTDAVEISAWGKDAAGDMTVVHSMLPAELFPMLRTGVVTMSLLLMDLPMSL